MNRIAVIGAGTMGNGIAQVFALHGRVVRLIDVAPALLDRGMETVRGSLARMVKDTLQRMNQTLLLPPYNLIVHSSPLQEVSNDFYHWHVEIMPKLTRVAGFEWGTGFYINPTGPEEAADVLRKVKL